MYQGRQGSEPVRKGQILSSANRLRDWRIDSNYFHRSHQLLMLGIADSGDEWRRAHQEEADTGHWIAGAKGVQADLASCVTLRITHH